MSHLEAAALTHDLHAVRSRLQAIPPETLSREEPPRDVKEIRSLNTIRGVAALMVAIFHAPALFGVGQTFPHAYLAVDLFFVLSGFVLLHAYEGRIRGGLGLARFAQLRLARLYPLLLIATVIGFAIMLAKHAAGRVDMNAETFAALPLSLILAPAPAGATDIHAAYPFVTQSWSIVWEIALCPVLFIWAKSVRRWAVPIAVVFALPLAWVAIARGDLDGGWVTGTFWIGALRAVVAFFAGVAVRQLTRRGPVPRWLNYAAIGAAVAVVIYVTLVRATFWWADYGAAVAGFPLIIAAAAQCRRRLLENWVGDRLGEASYSIYMLHNISIDVIVTGLKHLTQLGAAAHLLLGFGWLAVLIGGAWLSWRYVESPLRRLASRRDLLTWLTTPIGQRYFRLSRV
jgi:peptidoglycan/LPS O-acetylase OafA/YrhL